MWILIIITQIIFYLLIYIYIPTIFNGFIGTYVIRPILYITLTLEVLLISRYEGLKIWKFNKAKKLEIGRNPFEAALIFGGFYISLQIIAGLFFGFGRSPYSFTPLFIFINFIFVFSALFAFEVTRSYLTKKISSKRKYFTLMIILISILFIVLSTNPNNFSILNFSNPAGSVKYIGETLIPLFTINIFACYLVLIGGAKASIGYLGIIKAFEWYSPVLPNPPWQIASFIGIIAPAIGFLFIQNTIIMRGKKNQLKKRNTRDKDTAISWIAVASICVIIVLFSTGVFGYQPTTIYSGSMKPTIDVGDVVLISDVNPDEIKIGDIIQFPMENVSIPIIHRVTEINQINGDLYFITKGDSNSNQDSQPVHEQNVKGKVVYIIPKIGWISIAFKELYNNIEKRF